jgi:hypothetical protein
MAREKKHLSEIFEAAGPDLAERFAKSETAAENELLPAGWYPCELVDVSLDISKVKGTPSVVLSWKVVGESCTNRRVWQSLWLTDGAMSRTKRDLAKLGYATLDSLEDGLTARVMADVLVGERRDDDDGYEPRNEVRRFKVTGAEALDGVDDDEFPPAAAATDATSVEGK